MAGSVPWAASRRLWGWMPSACRSFSLGFPRLAFVRLTLPPPKVVDRSEYLPIYSNKYALHKQIYPPSLNMFHGEKIIFLVFLEVKHGEDKLMRDTKHDNLYYRLLKISLK